MDMAGLREIQLEKRAMGVRFLNASQAHLREVEQEARVDDRVILDQLREHLMGSLDVRDYGIPSSSFSRGRGSPRAKRSPSAHGSPGTRGSPSAKGTSV